MSTDKTIALNLYEHPLIEVKRQGMGPRQDWRVLGEGLKTSSSLC